MSNLQANVPAIFATKPAPFVSERYKFIPTTDYINALEAQGWSVTKASQTRTRKAPADTAKHMVTMEHSQYAPGSMELGGLSPRVHLLNSHNHSSRFKLILGIFRLVCSNGLMVSQGRIQALSFAHTQSARDVADVLTTEFFADANDNLERAKAWSAIDLTRDQQHALALTARNIRFGEDSTVDPASLLEARRSADVGDSLWLTFNRLQENSTRGGIRFPGMRRRSRNLTNIGKEVEVNTRLWTAAADMAKDWGLPG
jgi:hypothetical protein